MAAPGSIGFHVVTIGPADPKMMLLVAAEPLLAPLLPLDLVLDDDAQAVRLLAMTTHAATEAHTRVLVEESTVVLLNLAGSLPGPALQRL